MRRIETLRAIGDQADVPLEALSTDTFLAFKEALAVWRTSTPDSEPQATAYFAQAALEAQAEFIVNMSRVSVRPDSKSHSALQDWLSERVFDWAGTPVAHLRSTHFAEWLTRLSGVIVHALFTKTFENSDAGRDSGFIGSGVEETERNRGAD